MSIFTLLVANAADTTEAVTTVAQEVAEVITTTATPDKDPSLGLVIGMGLGVVFAGLICIIIICYLMSRIVKILEGSKAPEAAVPVSAPAAVPTAPVAAPIENRQELVAVIACAIAEELGTDVNAIRIKSIKKI